MKKRLLSVTLMCLLVAGLLAYGQQGVARPGQWDVTIEQIDLEKPENQKYIDWAEKDCAGKNSHQIYELPGPGEWTYPDVRGTPEKRLPWNEKMEFVIRWQYLSDCECLNELLVRNKATGRTRQIAEARVYSFDGSYFQVTEILSDTRFLYTQGKKGDAFDYQTYLFDLKTKESICVAAKNPEFFRDLGNGRHLWLDWKKDKYTINLTDMRALEAGEKGANRILIRWDEGYPGMQHLSSDNRFVYMGVYGGRWVYDIDTGKQVAFCEIPNFALEWTLISDDLEYGYSCGGTEDDPEIGDFYIIRYDRRA